MFEYTENELKALAIFAKRPDFILHSLILKRAGRIMESLNEQGVVVLSKHCAYTQPLEAGAKARIRQVLEGCGVIITGGQGGRNGKGDKLIARLKPETPCDVCSVEEAEWTAPDGSELCPECMICHQKENDLTDNDYKELPF